MLPSRNNWKFSPDNFGTVIQVAAEKRITSHAEAQRRRVSQHGAVVVSSASQRLCVGTYLAAAEGRAGKSAQSADDLMLLLLAGRSVPSQKAR